MASVFKRHGKGPYLIAYFDQDGRRHEKSARTTDKATAGRIAAKLEADVALRREGIIDAKADRLAKERRRPLAEHIGEFVDCLTAKGTSSKQVKLIRTRVKNVCEKAKIEGIDDLTSHRVQTAIGELGESGASAQTGNHVLRAVKQLARWLVRDGRIASDPLAHLKIANVDGKQRYLRRAYLDEELDRLLQAAEKGPTRLALSGADRAIAYRIAVGTGFRAAEIKSLCPESFSLDANPPTITVEAGYSKRRHRDTQPIRKDLAETLRPWLAKKASGTAVLPLPDKTARMIHADLRMARSAWIREVADPKARRKRRADEFLAIADHSGAVCDFHSLRHTYISRLVATGASVKVCQDLARHSTPTLTIGRYAHTRLHDLTRALDNLPATAVSHENEAMEMRATGTYNERPNMDATMPTKPPQNPQHLGRFSRRLGAKRCDEKERSQDRSRTVQPSAIAAVSNVVRHGAIGNATVAQLAEQRFCKPQVVGSNPTGGCFRKCLC